MKSTAGFFPSRRMILRTEMAVGPNVFARDPLPHEGIEAVESRKIFFGPVLVAGHLAVFEKEECGGQAVPGISDKRKFEIFGEDFRRDNFLEANQGPMTAGGSKKALADGGSRAFGNVNENGKMIPDLLLQPMKSEGMPQLKTKTIQATLEGRARGGEGRFSVGLFHRRIARVGNEGQNFRQVFMQP
jgi:hypothetical protein